MKIKLLCWKQCFIFVLLSVFLVSCGNNAKINTESNSPDDTQNDAFDGFSDAVDDVIIPEIEPIDSNDRPESLEQIVNELFGSMNAGVYINDALGIGCQISSDWKYYTEEELEEQNHAVFEILSDPDVAMLSPEELELVTINGTAMYASSSDGLANINLIVIRLNPIEAYSMRTTEGSISSTALEQLLDAYENLGCTDCIAEIAVLNILGGEHSAIITEASLGDIPLYITQVPIINGQNYGMITVSCYGENTTDEILSWFYTI